VLFAREVSVWICLPVHLHLSSLPFALVRGTKVNCTKYAHGEEFTYLLFVYLITLPIPQIIQRS
jgi:hypothetical protein